MSNQYNTDQYTTKPATIREIRRFAWLVLAGCMLVYVVLVASTTSLAATREYYNNETKQMEDTNAVMEEEYFAIIRSLDERYSFQTDYVIAPTLEYVVLSSESNFAYNSR